MFWIFAIVSEVADLDSGDVKKVHHRFSPMDNLGFRSKKCERPNLMPE